MPRLQRPLDRDAVQAADEQLYAQYANAPRPNALYDANGNRLKLDADDPAQAGLRKQWRDLYTAELNKKKAAQPPAPSPPEGDGPVDDPVRDCPEKLHWIRVRLIRLPDAKPRPAFWPARDDGPYPYEAYDADVTDGPKKDALGGDGKAGYDKIPAGSCTWKFTQFYQLVEETLKPAPAVADATSVTGPVKPQPQKYTVELVVRKPTLTLKHDNETKLEIKVTPDDGNAGDFRIEIKRVSGGSWVELARAQELKPWTARIAGKFKLRGVAVINGQEVASAEKDLEVQFPTYSQIVGDADVQTAVSAAWTATLNDCTDVPNRRRERAFWILLNTTTDEYEFGPTSFGAWAGPGSGASVNPGGRPADVPAAPKPEDAGATYSVGLFHTHTPTEFRAVGRGIGPSGADNNFHNTHDVPGVVYDFTESPAGSGNIPAGHPKTSAAQLYHSQGRTRRTTPP